MYKINHKIKSYFSSPLRQFVASFIALIFSGTALLLLPWSTVQNISLIDAFFTSTSAVCVTGLIVLDTAKDFTLFGQCVILILIQLGGFGIMTFSIAIFSFFGSGFSIKWKFTFGSIYNDMQTIPVGAVLKRIILYTLTIESVAAVILFSRFIKDFDIKNALWHSIFHAVSAFCNAGFSTFSSSLMDYRDDPVINITVMITVILGGLGFIVLTELIRTEKRRENIFKKFTLHSKIVLFTTFSLIISGAVIILILEWSHSIKGDPLDVKLLVSFFQSVTCRTAGFNTVDISRLRESTLTVMMLLMFIGGAPGSMAGGVKVTTFAVITGIILSKFKGKKEIVFWHRAISEEIIQKSTTLVILAFTVIYISTIILLSLHSFDLHNSFLSVIFEIISAFGTVGLSTGITPSIPEEGKILITLVMFTGRIGIYAIITAITANIKPALFSTAEENIMIG